MLQQTTESIVGEPTHPGLEALEDGFLMVDRKWRIIYWNAAAERLIGVGRQALIGRDLWTALSFLQETSSWDVLPRVARGGVARRFIDVFPGYVEGFVSVHAAPVPSGGLAVHFRDATDEVAQAEQYSALLESLDDGFVAVDDEWHIVYTNGAAERLLGFSRDRTAGCSVWAFLPKQPHEIGECLRATRADGVNRQLRSVRPPGRTFRGRTFDFWTYPLAGGGISVRFQDVTERVSHEEKLSRLAREAEEANRAKSRFFTAVSHELRTPLNAIVGYAHLLATGTYCDLPPGAQRAAERTQVCAEHLARLVDDLLLLTASEVSRLRVTLQPLPLEPFLRAVSLPYRLQAEAKGLSFDIHLPDGIPPPMTDPGRLQQILGAMLNNSVRYTRVGGIRLEARFAGRDVRITVADTGPGIDSEDAERIFDAFEQVADGARSDPLENGSGLGLTLARQLTALLGGHLELESSTAAGSRFTITLPIQPEP